MPSEKIDVLDIIKQHFKYIYKDLINEYPDIKLYGKYNLLKEIVIDNLVVGFSLYSFEDDFKVGKMYLEYYYVLHEYRDRFYLYDDIFEAWEYGQFLVSIHNPKRETIELLIKERKACMLNDRFVLSHFDLIYDVALKEVSFNKSIKNSCDLSNIDGIKMYGCEGDIYDLELCSVVPIFFLDWKENEEDIQLSVAYDDEDEKYGCLSKRVNENLIKQNNYLTTSVMVFNDFIKEQGGHLGYDLRY